MSSSYWRLGRVDDAIKYGLMAQGVQVQLTGPDHPEVAKHLGDLAELYLEQGDAESAERMARETVRILAASLGPENTITLWGACRWGVRSRASAGGRGRRRGQKGMEGVQAKLPPDHPMVIEFFARVRGRAARPRRLRRSHPPRGEGARAARQGGEQGRHRDGAGVRRPRRMPAREGGLHCRGDLPPARDGRIREGPVGESRQRVRAEARFLLAKARSGIGDAAGSRADADAALAVFMKVGTARAKRGAEAVKAWLEAGR